MQRPKFCTNSIHKQACSAFSKAIPTFQIIPLWIQIALEAKLRVQPHRFIAQLMLILAADQGANST